MARQNFGFQKRQRELAKKQKREEKAQRRQARKEAIERGEALPDDILAENPALAILAEEGDDDAATEETPAAEQA
jgi:hypothetical protein